MAGNLYKWRLSTGGDAGVANNWSDLVNGNPSGTLPGSSDEAEFANAGGTITGGLTVAEWVITSTAGFYTFTGGVAATEFLVNTSAALTGTWTQTGSGQIGIAGGVFTLGPGGALVSQSTDNSVYGLLVDGTLVSNGGSITVADLMGIGATGTGLSGTGTLSAGAGSSLNAGVIHLGINSGGSGTLALSNGASAGVSQYVAVGAVAGGTGSVTVTGGALLSVGALYDGAGGTGVTDVSGAGSAVEVGTGGLAIGQGSNGTLTVENGATLTDAGLIDIGLGGTGTLVARTGARIASVGGDIGRSATSTPGTGSVLLDASVWNSSGQILVGAGANGGALLQVEDGATLQATAVLDAGVPFLLVDETVARQAVADIGDAVVNAGSDSIDVGEAGFGSLTLHDGAVLDAGTTSESAAFLLGDQANSVGTVTLSGAGTTVNVSGDATIGVLGAGTLSVGGTFAVTGEMGLGVGQSGQGVVTVSGVGSDLAVSGALDLGGNSTQVGGAGALTVGSNGTLTAGSAVLYAGGTLTVNGGGSASIGTGSTQSAGALIVDAGATAGSGMDVSGVGSGVTLGSHGMLVGDDGTGVVTVQNGATLADGGVAEIGLGGTGSLTIETGSQFVSVGAALGAASGGTAGSGSVLVDASEWISSGQILVGAGTNGIGLLRIEDNAFVQASTALGSATPFLFVDGTAAGQAVVDVGGAVIEAGANSADIGEAGFGMLTLHDGALLAVGASGQSAGFLLGDQDGAVGTASLSGAGTKVNVSGAATIGASGAGTLTILGGTLTTTGNMALGVGTSGSGVVSLTGSGSDLAVGGQLDLGGAIQAGGSGALTVGSGGTLTAASLMMFAGGTLTVDAGGDAEIGGGGAAVAGQLVIDAGVTAGGSGEVAAAVTNHGSLVAQNGTLEVTGLTRGGGSYDVAGGATLELDDPGDVKLGFLSTSGTIVLGTASGAASILQMSGGDTLRLVGLGTGAEVSYAGDTATVSGSDGSWSLIFGGTPPALAVTSEGNDALVVACYVEGTAISTPEGMVPIERLAVGQRVLTFEGAAREIVWLGRCEVDCRNHPTPSRVWPVRVAADAFGPGMPARPLFLSPDHAVFVDEVLIPMRYLIDGAAVWQVERDMVVYWHLELASHDVVLAEGLPAESFLGDRERFGAMARLGLYPDFTSLHWEACGYAPLVVTGPALARVRARIGREMVGVLA